MTKASLDYYADAHSGAWQELGFDPFPAGGPPADVRLLTRPALTSIRQLRDSYDAVVVGSGAGGGVVACVLAEAGASVLVVERGHWFGAGDLATDHVRNHRFFFGGDLDTPPGHPRAVPEDRGELAIDSDDLRYHHNAITVGGGTRFFGAQAWRFLPDDFRMASLYGVPEGSALADWPISYDELEPFYDKVEWELGVAGSGHPGEGARRRGYPMAPFPHTRPATTLAGGATALGWPTGDVPLLINTEPRDDRAACIRCGQCVGFACPVDARNGTNTTVLPRALARSTDLITETQVTRVSDNGEVEIVVGDESRTVRAGRIVLAGGAIETARLLQLSQIGNDWVGDCLQGHLYANVFGLFGDEVHDGLGPGPSIATRHFSHGNDGVVGGGLLGHDFIKIPTMHYALGLPPDVDRSGPDVRQALAETYRRTINIQGPVHEIPTREARVRLAGTVVDRVGVPVARLEGLQHREDLRTCEFLSAKAEQWLLASGATRTWRMGAPNRSLSGGQHQAGTARMSDSPRHGATDPLGKVWGTDRIYVADSSVHVTNGGANPVLTIMALAWRTAEGVAQAG